MSLSEQYNRFVQRYFSSHIGFIALALSIALVTRGLLVWDRQHPINDGGFWYVFAQQVEAGHFALPDTLSFNGESVALSYPPLAAYVIAGSHALFGVDYMTLLLWIPAMLSVLSVLAFAYFAIGLAESKVEAHAAIVLFPVLPNALRWFAMGGGVARGLGLVFLLLSLGALARCRESRNNQILAGVLAALCILSHPVAALALVLGTVALIISRRLSVSNCLLPFFGAAALLTPWLVREFRIADAQSGLRAFDSAPYGITEFAGVFSLGNITAGLGIGFILSLVGFCDGVRCLRSFPMILFLLMAVFAPIKMESGLLALPICLFMARGAAVMLEFARSHTTPRTPSTLVVPLAFLAFVVELSFHIDHFKSQSMSDREFQSLTEFAVAKDTPHEVYVLTQHFIAGDAVGEWLTSLGRIRVPWLHQLREWKGDFWSLLSKQFTIEACCSKRSRDACLPVFASPEARDYILHLRSCDLPVRDLNLPVACEIKHRGVDFAWVHCQ